MVSSIQNISTAPPKRYVFNPPNNMSKTPIYDNVWRNKDLLDTIPRKKTKAKNWSAGDIIRAIVGMGALIGACILFKRFKGAVKNFINR